ncbi:MAG: YkgJ family cysteine cluster protein [Negativicutes bacterium]|nr:YkgJ family cysteine cluster protein [Negativicutes bacterium]
MFLPVKRSSTSEIYNLFSDLHDGDGVCRYYDEEVHLCSIYENRPDKCNVEKGFELVAGLMSYQEYLQRNIAMCEKLKALEK